MKSRAESTAHELLASFLELGMDEESLTAELTWYPRDGKLHGSHLCGRAPDDFSVPILPERYVGERVSRTLQSLTPQEVCKECSRVAMAGASESYSAGCLLLASHLELEEPLPEHPGELLSLREKLEYSWMMVHMVGDHEALMPQYQDLTRRMQEREAEIRRRFLGEGSREAILSEVRRSMRPEPGDEEDGLMVVVGKVHPLTAKLYAQVVEHFRVAALHAEVEHPWDAKVPDPTYVVVAPRMALSYLVQAAPWLKTIGGIRTPPSLEPAVLQTGFSLWESAVEGELTDLGRAFEVAGQLHTRALVNG